MPRINPNNTATHKQCYKCKSVLPREDFRNSSCTKDGKMMLCRPCDNKKKIKSKRHRKYKLSIDEFNRLMQTHTHCCICGDEFNSENPPKIDHCHTTQKVRGLLCHFCNVGLGFFRDNPEILSKAILYLYRATEQSPPKKLNKSDRLCRTLKETYD